MLCIQIRLSLYENRRLIDVVYPDEIREKSKWP